jgi:hypothetical protein
MSLARPAPSRSPWTRRPILVVMPGLRRTSGRLRHHRLRRAAAEGWRCGRSHGAGHRRTPALDPAALAGVAAGPAGVGRGPRVGRPGRSDRGPTPELARQPTDAVAGRRDRHRRRCCRTSTRLRWPGQRARRRPSRRRPPPPRAPRPRPPRASAGRPRPPRRARAPRRVFGGRAEAVVAVPRDRLLEHVLSTALHGRRSMKRSASRMTSIARSAPYSANTIVMPRP